MLTCRCWLVDVGIFVLWQAVDLWIFWSLMNGKLCGALKRLALATRALRLICMKDCMAGRFTFTFFIFIYSVSHFVCECMHSSLIQRYYGEWLERGWCLCCRYPGYPPWSVEEPSYTCWDEEKWVFIHVKLVVFAELAGPLCNHFEVLIYNDIGMIYLLYKLCSFQHLTMQLGNFYGNRPKYGLPVSRTSWPKQHELCFRSRQGTGQVVGWLAWGYSSRASHPNLWG